MTTQTDEEKFAEWLGRLLKQNGIRKSQLAEYMGVSRQAVSNWFSKGKISTQHLVTLESLFNQRCPYSSIDRDKDLALLRASMNGPAFMHTQNLHQNDIHTSWSDAIDTEDTNFTLKMSSNVLCPLFKSGDVVYVDTSIEAHNGDLVLIHVAGDREAFIRRIIMEGGCTVYVAPTEKLNYLEPIKDSDRVKLIGKITGRYTDM